MAEEKQCRGCQDLQPLDNYYKHSAMLGGHLNYCKKCVKNRVRQHRENNLDKIQAYDRGRAALPHRRALLQSLKDRHKADPLKLKAHRTTSNAIRDGKLIRPPSCSQCGKQCAPEAHHHDYSMPLDVIWLCRSCHCRHHRNQAIIALAQ